MLVLMFLLVSDNRRVLRIFRTFLFQQKNVTIFVNRRKINQLTQLILRNFTEFYLLAVSKTLQLHKINLINQINGLNFSRLIQLIDY